MTTYLCTCGTSAFKIDKFGGQKLSAKWVEEKGGIAPAAQAIYNSFCNKPFDDEEVWRRDLSAELHSLARMQVSEKDTVILYSSETPDGQACAIAVQMYLQKVFPGIVCNVDVVEGLQVQDEARFRRLGVVEFTRKILRKIENYGPNNVILNPTGGFKSLVPYTVMIGMIRNVRARYIFEQSSTLLDLPRLPVDFARSRLGGFLALLQEIERETAMPRKEWEERVPHEERLNLDPLVERFNGEITLSSLGILVLEELARPRALTPFLSRRAWEDLTKIWQLPGRDPMEFLERVSRDRALFESKIHAKLGDNFYWLKPGDVSERYLVSIQDWRLLVWRICDHSEYEKFTPNPAALQHDNRYFPFGKMEIYRG